MAVYARMAVFNLASSVAKYLTGYLKGHCRRAHGRTHRVAGTGVGVASPSVTAPGGASRGANGKAALRRRRVSSGAGDGADDAGGHKSSGDSDDGASTKGVPRRGTPAAARADSDDDDDDGGGGDSDHDDAVFFPDESDADIRRYTSSLLVLVGVCADWLLLHPDVLDDAPILHAYAGKAARAARAAGSGATAGAVPPAALPSEA